MLALAMLSLAVIHAGARQILAVGETPQSGAMVGLGMFAVAIAAIVGLLAWRGWAVAARVRRAPVAEWRVSAPVWAAFRHLDAERRAAFPAYSALLKPRRKPPAAGVEVIAGRGAILIDGAVFGLEPRGLNPLTAVQWLAGTPEVIEFTLPMITASPGASAIRVGAIQNLLRAPVEPPQREAALRAYAHYQTLIEGGEISDKRDTRTAIKLALSLATIAMPLGGLGFWLNAEGLMADSIVPVLLALLGTIFGLGALLWALVIWGALLRRRR